MKKFLLVIVFLIVVLLLISIFTPLERVPKLHFLTGQAKKSFLSFKNSFERKIKEIEQKLKEKKRNY